jgi:hypothetical protein
VDVVRAAIRRSVTVTFVDLGEADEDGRLTPDEASDLLAPYGNELRLWRGVDFQDGTDPEYVPIGTFVMTKVEGDYPTLTVTGKDRMFLVQEARPESALKINRGLVYSDVLEDLLRDRLPPWVDLEIAPSDETTPTLLYDMAEDMAEKCHEMAQSLGHMLYMDPMGVGRTVPEPEVEDAMIVATYVEEEGGRLLKVRKVLDTEQTKNVVVATGDSTDAGGVRGVAYDDNPRSPTYAGEPGQPSKFGRRPYFHTSPLYTSAGMAASGARTILQRVIGLGQELTFEGLPNPAHEAGDHVLVDRPVAGVTSEVHVLDEFPVHLEAGQVGTVGSRLLQEPLP